MTPERKNRIENVMKLRQKDLVVFVEELSNPHNVGAVMRTADAVGVGELHYVAKGAFPIANGVTQGSHKWLKLVEHQSTEDGLLELKQRGFRIVTTRLGMDSLDFRKIDYTIPTVIVLGNEIKGVSDEALFLSDVNVWIPTYGMVQSLNISVAAAVILYEAQRQRSLLGKYDVNDIGRPKGQDFYSAEL